MNKQAVDKATAYIKDWLRFRYERDDMPGFAVAIAKNGKIIFNEAYGYADLEKKIKMTPEHLFRIASHSKTFTATAIMQLQEQGKLRIDDKVVGYLPWLKEHKDKRWSNVTIRQLLSHGAGVIRDGLEQGYWTLNRPFPDEKRFKKDIMDAELVFDSNTRMKYSNYGYSLLGMVVESVSGQSYNGFVTQNICRPLGLKNTGPELIMAIENRLVTGYTRADYGRKRLPIAHVNTQAMSAATGFYSNTADLAKYFTAHIVGSGKLLDDESKKEMQRTQWQAEDANEKVEYGLGFEIEHLDKRRLLGHGGGFPGNITKSYFDGTDKLVVIVLTNCIGGWVGHMGKGVIKTLDYFGDHASNKSDFDKFQGRFMSLFGITDFIASGKKLLAVYPDSWEPFHDPDELEHVKDSIFKIKKTSSFEPGGELVQFSMGKLGKVESVTYAGEKQLPEKVYLQQTAKDKKIG